MTGLVAATMLGSITLAGVALADDIYNDLDPSIDAVAEVMALEAGGADGTTILKVQPRNGDGENGCNLVRGQTASFEVVSSDASVATVSPASVTFTSCSDSRALTVTGHAPGRTTVSLVQTSNTTPGSFNLAPATFLVDVTAATPTNTPPSLEITGVTTGASYPKGSVPAATCQVTDAEDGDPTFPATLSGVSGPWSVDGIGAQTASCSYTDSGGLTAASSVTYFVVDPSAPTVGHTLTPASPDGDNGWYRSDVSLTWTVTEPESPSSLVTTGCVDQAVTQDQAETAYLCSATSAGGEAAGQSVSVKRDSTAPVVAPDVTVSGTEGLDGWFTSDVVVTFTADDALSGPASAERSVSSAGEGAAVLVASPEFTDLAGNTAAEGSVVKTFKVDTSAPTGVTFDGGPADEASYYFGSVPDAPTCTAQDAVSGLRSCLVTGFETAVGTHTLTATATDHAGLTATATRTYTVRAWDLSGFYRPVTMGADVVNTVKAGSTVPLKFEVFAGAELTDVSTVSSFTASRFTCGDTTGAEDPVDFTTTGGTTLRYDSTAGQFVQNWQTPKAGAGSCYVVTMTTQDGSRLKAVFKLK